MSEGMSVWTIFDSPDDFPGQFVARRSRIEPGQPDLIVTDDVKLSASLPALRAAVREALPGAVRFVRAKEDPASVIETWL